MARERFCKVCRGWHDLSKDWPIECYPEVSNNRSDLSSPMLITDTMKPVQSQLDGKMYDSKSKLRSTYKAAGMVELGNDSSVTNPTPLKRKPPSRKEIRDSLDKGFSRAGLGA